MQFPSIKSLALSARNVIHRFPFEILFALAGTIAATFQIEVKHLNRVSESWCLRTIMIANLGLLLSLATTLFTEAKNITGGRKLGLRLAATAIAVTLLFLINPYDRETDYIRFFLLALSLHLLVAFAAFTGKGHIQGFWQFNKSLFLRFLASALYSAVLFLGLAAAIGSMNLLFNFKFEWDTFAVLWVWIVGMFNTLFFLAGVPANTGALDSDASYPKGLKVFTQYVLIPLATVYVLILLAYEAKILVQWHLPKGMVSNLILSYAVFGILSLLLVFPIREQEENKWIKTYARSFYFLMLPLLALLFLAVGTRVNNYGVTELRYFLIVLACWLLFITVYFLTSRKQNIKIIPVSLAIVTLLSVYGPQSAFSISKYSQRGILIKIFKRNHAFTSGKLVPITAKKVNKEDGERAIATLEYLTRYGDLEVLQPYIDKDLTAVSDSLATLKSPYGRRELSRYELREKKTQWLKSYLGLSKFSAFRDYDANEGLTNVGVRPLDEDVLDVRNFDFVIYPNNYGRDTLNRKIDNITIASFVNDDKTLTLTINNEKLTFEAMPVIDSLLRMGSKLAVYKTSSEDAVSYEAYAVPQQLITINKETKRFKVVFKINTLSFGRTSQNKLDRVQNVGGVYLVKMK